MSIQFPSPASQGDTFTASNGVVYTYDNGGWTADSSLNSGQLAGFRNQLINGDFRVWQRGTSFDLSTSSGKAYTADRWYVSSTNGTVNRAGASNPAPSGSNGRCLSLSGDVGTLRQGIECAPPDLAGMNGAFVPNSQWTLSWYSSVSTTTATVGFKNGDITSQPAVGDRLLNQSSGTSLGNNRYSASFVIPAGPIPADTNMFFVMLFLSDGESISEIQLEPGPVATPFEQRPIGTELALCQRYFYKSDANLRLYPPAHTSGQRFGTWPRPVTMRAVPTETQSTSSLTLSGTADVINVVGSQPDASSGLLLTGYTADAEL